MCHQRSGSTKNPRASKNTRPTRKIPIIAGNENTFCKRELSTDMRGSVLAVVSAEPKGSAAVDDSVSGFSAIFASLMGSKYGADQSAQEVQQSEALRPMGVLIWRHFRRTAREVHDVKRS